MPSYRLYYLSSSDHIVSADVVIADDDEAARAEAKLLCARNDRPVEIWRGPRMLGAYSAVQSITSATP
jgi:hypothetical protein